MYRALHKWWDVVPVGATLIAIDSREGLAVFESDHDGTAPLERWTVNLWTDEVER